MLKEILNENRILTDVDLDTWEDAAKKVGELLLINGDIKEGYINSMIDTVNKYGPYMILLPEICLFHGEPGELVNKASLSLITLKNPIYFKEFDNQKITCALGFCAKDSEGHLSMLTKLSSILQDEEFIRLVRNNGSKSEILKKVEEY